MGRPLFGKKAPWRERRSTLVDPLERQKKRQASGQQRGRRGRGRLASTGRGRCGGLAVVADPSASESSSSRSIGVAADGLGQRDDCSDLGDAMDILQGLRFHMLGRQWQMLDDMVATKLRADAARGHTAQAGAAHARSSPAVKPGRGAGRPRKQVELLKREIRSLKQVVCRLRGLVRRLKAELQAKIDKMRAKTSVLKTPKRERAARRATERGVVSLAGGCRCASLRNIGQAGADAVVAHLDAGIARQTEQLLGANVLAHARAFSNDQYTQLHAARSAEVESESSRLDVGSACFAR